MIYEEKPIQCLYKGRIYRSKLEVTWSIYFELLGFSYEYEPIDFKYWFPDFLICTDAINYYVEIKPITEIDIKTTKKMEKCLHAHNNSFGIILCGLFPIENSFGWVFNYNQWTMLNKIGNIENNIVKWNEAKNIVRYEHKQIITKPIFKQSNNRNRSRVFPNYT
jgi:hypothetical protein